ncbi:MAG: serine hydrolase [Polyangiaceae bacterium]
MSRLTLFGAALLSLATACDRGEAVASTRASPTSTATGSASSTNPASIDPAPSTGPTPSTSLSNIEIAKSAATAIPNSAPPPRALTPPKEPLIDADVADDWLPRTTAAEARIDGPLLDVLCRDALSTASDSLLVLVDDKILVERYFQKPHGVIETRSATKSVALLAVLALIADGAIPSLDAPLSTWFPEFAEGRKAKITLRHVLTHTTGLASDPKGTAINDQSDRLAFARGLEVKDEPGTRFLYSNEGAELLSGVIKSAAGEPADTYVKRRLFIPIGITDDVWRFDRAGNVQTYFGLRLTARDLARIGLLLLHDGNWNGVELLPKALLAEAVKPSAVYGGYGLLFWLRSPVVASEARLMNINPAFVEALAPLAGRHYRSEDEYFSAAKAYIGDGGVARLRSFQSTPKSAVTPVDGPLTGYYAVGGQGQRMAVYPRAHIVAVRQHRRVPGDVEIRVAWRGFHDRVEALSPELDP